MRCRVRTVGGVEREAVRYFHARGQTTAGQVSALDSNTDLDDIEQRRHRCGLQSLLLDHYTTVSKGPKCHIMAP